MWAMGYNQNDKGFTFIELIMTILIVGILSTAGVFLLTYLAQNSAKVPSQLNMDMVAVELLDTMIEGDVQAKGIRFAQSITAIAQTQLNFVNQDGQAIQYRLSGDKIYRKIDSQPEGVIPYYASSGVFVYGDSGRVFRFYDANGVEINPVSGDPQDVRRVGVTVIAQTTSGVVGDWDGRSQQSSSVTIYSF